MKTLLNKIEELKTEKERKRLDDEKKHQEVGDVLKHKDEFIRDTILGFLRELESPFSLCDRFEHATHVATLNYRTSTGRQTEALRINVKLGELEGWPTIVGIRASYPAKLRGSRESVDFDLIPGHLDGFLEQIQDWIAMKLLPHFKEKAD